jgi:hypothetical protein
MNITKYQVASKYNILLEKVTQVKHQQMFLCAMQGEIYVVSYLTVVGKFDRISNKWQITDYKYSPTTSKQLTLFKRENPNHVVVSGEIKCKH